MNSVPDRLKAACLLTLMALTSVCTALLPASAQEHQPSVVETRGRRAPGKLEFHQARYRLRAGEAARVYAPPGTLDFARKAKMRSTRIRSTKGPGFEVGHDANGDLLIAASLTTEPGEHIVEVSMVSDGGEERTATITVGVDPLLAVQDGTTKAPVVLLNGWQRPNFNSTCPIAVDGPVSTFGALNRLLSADGVPAVYFFDNCVECQDCTIERLGNRLRDVLNLIRSTDGTLVPRVDLIGHSMGGLIARSYLAGLQEDGSLLPPSNPRIRKLVQVATPNFGASLNPFNFGTQLSELYPGSRFLWSLATWNRRGDDLRGVDALAVIGKDSQRSDGVVSLTSASLSFARDNSRTRILPYCHSDGLTPFFCSSPRGIANVDQAPETWEIIRSFLNGTLDWMTIGRTPNQDAYLSQYGGLYLRYANANNQYYPDVSRVLFGTIPLDAGGATNEIFYTEFVSGTGSFSITRTGLGPVPCGPYTQTSGLYVAVRCKQSPRVSSVGPLLGNSTSNLVPSGSTITISGTDFGQQQCSSCRVQAIPSATQLPSTLPIVSWSDGSIRANLSASFNGLVRVVLQTATGQDDINVMTTPCAFTITGGTASFSGTGGTGSLNVFVPAGCAWTAIPDVPWVTVTSGTSGSGNGFIGFSVSPNATATSRTGILNIGFVQFVISQSAAPTCNYQVIPTNLNPPANGGVVTVNVTTGSGCNWTANGSATWLSFPSGQSGSGTGALSLAIAANSSTDIRTAAITVAGVTVTFTQVAAGVPTPLRFVSLAPCRLMETRAEYNFQGRTGAFGPPFLAANETRTLTLPNSNVCQVPATASAYVLNVTLVPRGNVNFATVWPAGDPRPNVWTIRSPDGNVVANSAIVKAGTAGGISVFASDNTDLLIDITGYFAANAAVSNLAYYPLTPCRVIETRSAYRASGGAFGPPTLNPNETRRYRFPSSPDCPIPVGASAYAVTITAVPPGPLQFLTAWPSGQSQPNVSNINSPAGRVLANSVIIPAGSDSIDVFAFNQTDFLVDINGYFAPDDGQNGLFYFPVVQCRAVDTTSAAYTGLFGPPAFGDNVTRSIAIPGSGACVGIPTSAKAYALSVTGLPGGSPMPFLTVYPTGQIRPNASILNAFQGQVVTNSAIVPAGVNGSIDIYAFKQTNVVVEINGYFGR